MSDLILNKIWDPITRLWHWALVITVCTGWGFGRYMSFDNIQWHFYLGYTTLGLIIFRLIWGFVGPQNIRLRALVPSPQETKSYLQHVLNRTPSGTPGHNPIGSISVLAMLLAIGAQAVTGLFMESDDFFESAPLVGFVDEHVAHTFHWLHHSIANVILVLVVLHVTAIVFYRVWKKENLIKPMITGWKWVKRR